MAVNGRNKGNAYERKFTRPLSEWWFGQDFAGVRANHLPFKRSPGSGGWNKQDAAHDLITPADFPLGFEFKNQQAWKPDGLFKNNEKWPVWDYWRQCVNSCREEGRGRRPCVIFTRNQHPDYLLMRRRDMKAIGIVPHIRFRRLALSFFERLIEVDPDTLRDAFPLDEEKNL